MQKDNILNSGKIQRKTENGTTSTNGALLSTLSIDDYEVIGVSTSFIGGVGLAYKSSTQNWGAVIYSFSDNELLPVKETALSVTFYYYPK